MKKPIIGITMGDPAGNGSEISVKALSRPEIYKQCRPVIIGDAACMDIGEDGGQLHHGHQVSGAGGRHCRAAGDHRLCQGHDAADAPEDRQGRRGLGALGQ